MGNESIYTDGNMLEKIFPVPKPIIATLHLLSLPGSHHYRGESMGELLDYTLDEVKDLIDAGVDGLIIENHGDIPFLQPDEIGYETVSAMTYIGTEVQKYAAAYQIPVGVNCLANAAIPALAIGKAITARFVRVNQFVNAYIANEGFIEGLAGKIMRYRTMIKAEDIAIFADVHVKHGSHSIVADRSIREQAKDVLFFCGDVLICTGSRTGDPPEEHELREIKVTPDTPVIIGSGLTVETAERLLAIADGAIVASDFKEDGVWQHKVSRERVLRFMDSIRQIRQKISVR